MMMKRSDFIKAMGIAAAAPVTTGANFIPKQALQRPERLKAGDLIGLTAPAGIIYEESEFERMRSVLEDFGFRVRFGKHVKSRHGYLSGTDQERASDLNRMFADPEIKGILAVRGGWGCARILPHLDFKVIARNPKVYCGFSDNTTLHHALSAYSGLLSFHGPNGNSDWTDLTKQSFKSVVMDAEASVFKSNSDLITLFRGKAAGRLIGGNLSILTTTLGTPYQPDFKESILFVEDIGENTYKIDRMMSHLARAGALSGISGFVFGKCTDCSAGSAPTFSLVEVLKHHLGPLGIPAIFNADIGHEEDNFTIPCGGMGELDANSGIFRLTAPAVR